LKTTQPTCTVTLPAHNFITYINEKYEEEALLSNRFKKNYKHAASSLPIIQAVS
jgi:hypothetical protein